MRTITPEPAKRSAIRILVSCSLIVSHLSAGEAASITAAWANNGEDKVTRDELRASQGTSVSNSVWNGKRIRVFGARNEVVAFNVVLEAADQAAGNISVSFNELSGPNGAVIRSFDTSGDGVFNWTQRPIELFYVRYLQIRGVSRIFYDAYDERHAPVRMRRPWAGDGMGTGGWRDRPGHDKYYPEIAVPIELVPRFSIARGENQSIWADVYIPKTAAPGLYQGEFQILEAGAPLLSIPVELQVCNLTLPDLPAAKTMLYYSTTNINRRYIGSDPAPESVEGQRARLIRDRHFLLAHRHGISLIGDAAGLDCANPGDAPCPEWRGRLDGSLFTAANGYDGPGVNVGNNVYSIGTYASWGWQSDGEAAMHRHADNWVTWFQTNAPNTEYFLYLIDESSDYAQIETWASWILSNPGPGKALRSLATLELPTAVAQTPSLDIPTSTLWTGDPRAWEQHANRYTIDGRKRFYVYNGHRPATGSFATEDEGTALRQLAWAHYKKNINRWFFWESTYYNNYQGNTGQVNVFQTAHTFGNRDSIDPVRGESGWNYANGDGVLFYPGTDRVFPSDSYGIDGPFASLRLKHWRRGIQDVAHLVMAAGRDPGGVRALVDATVPKVLWEYGVSDPSDPTWIRADIAWSPDPQPWEAARGRLIGMVTGNDPMTGAALSVGPLLRNVRVYPNPWRKDRHQGSPITFSNLPPGAIVKIFTVAAHLVEELPPATGSAVTWDLKTRSGDSAASGLYLYTVTMESEKTSGKLAIIQ